MKTFIFLRVFWLITFPRFHCFVIARLFVFRYRINWTIYGVYNAQAIIEIKVVLLNPSVVSFKESYQITKFVVFFIMWHGFRNNSQNKKKEHVKFTISISNVMDSFKYSRISTLQTLLLNGFTHWVSRRSSSVGPDSDPAVDSLRLSFLAHTYLE